jgi:hypothetical protein
MCWISNILKSENLGYNIGTLNVLKVEPFSSNITTIMFQKKNLILCTKKRALYWNLKVLYFDHL